MTDSIEAKRAALTEKLDDLFFLMVDEGVDVNLFAEEMEVFFQRVVNEFGWVLALESKK